MKIELKKVSINLRFSQETIQFQADLYINGKKAAMCSNAGHGGSTDILSYKDQHQLVKDAAMFYQALPPEKHEFLGKIIEYPQSLDLAIDNIIAKKADEMERDKFQKKRAKDMLKGILYGNDSSYKMISWPGMTIASLKAHPQGKDILTKELKKLKDAGNSILNTNLEGY